MATPPTTPSLIPPKPNPLKVTITGDKAAGKSCLAQLIAGFLKLHGHDAYVIEKQADGQKYIVRDSDRAKEFNAPREIKIEVKAALVKAD